MSEEPLSNSEESAPRPLGRPFVKGQSGNPGGRPKIPSEFKTSCRKAVDEHVLTAWINEVVTHGKEWVRCSELLASYGYGKPSQPIELDATTLDDKSLRQAVAEIVEQWKNEGLMQ